MPSVQRNVPDTVKHYAAKMSKQQKPPKSAMQGAMRPVYFEQEEAAKLGFVPQGLPPTRGTLRSMASEPFLKQQE